MTVTVVEPQGRSREAGPEEAADKLSTVGTQTDREAGGGRRAGWQQRSPKVIQTQPVESDGTRGQNQHLTLPGEISPARTGEKSAEAVVARMACESRPERRAEGPRNGARGRTPGTGERDQESRGASTPVATPTSSEGQKRWNRGEPQAAIPRRELGEFPDREPCTRT